MRAMNVRKMYETNISLVLNTIRTNQGISRYEISRITNLSPSAVSSIVNFLIKSRFIIEIPKNVISIGRKPIGLFLNNKTYFSIGIEIESDKITGVVINLVGEIIGQKVDYISSSINYKDVLDKVIDIYFSLSQDFKEDQILGLGIAIPGMVDSQNGISIFSENLGWHNVHIKKSS